MCACGDPVDHCRPVWFCCAAHMLVHVYTCRPGSAHHARQAGSIKHMQNFCTAALTEHTVCIRVAQMCTLLFINKLHVDRVSRVWTWQHRGHIQSDNHRRMLGGCFWVPTLLLSRVGAICMQATGFAAVLQQCSTEGLHSNKPRQAEICGFAVHFIVQGLPLQAVAHF